MARWRILASLVALLILAGAAQAQTYSLAEPAQPGGYFSIQLSMGLHGQLNVLVDGKDKSLKESATANHDYIERILEAGPDGTAAKSARIYKDARVVIMVEANKLDRALRKVQMSLRKAGFQLSAPQR